jgi:hypothetical protein
MIESFATLGMSFIGLSPISAESLTEAALYRSVDSSPAGRKQLARWFA